MGCTNNNKKAGKIMKVGIQSSLFVLDIKWWLVGGGYIELKKKQ